MTEVAERYGVSRQSVHAWIRRYAEGGLGALADRSRRPESRPHQVCAEVEAAVCELRREHPRWGPLRLAHELGRVGVVPVPSRMSVYTFAEPGEDGLVFVGPMGGRLRRSNFRRIWTRARNTIGLPDLHFHDLRHAGNTMAARQGASLRELMERMGHSSARAALTSTPPESETRRSRRAWARC